MICEIDQGFNLGLHTDPFGFSQHNIGQLFQVLQVEGLCCGCILFAAENLAAGNHISCKNDMQFVQLLPVYRTRRISEGVRSVAQLGKGDYLAQGGRVRQQHDQAVQTQGKSTVRRCSETEGIKQEAETVPDIFL